MKDKKRETYYDFLRGIAIIFVIGIHTYVDDTTHISLVIRQFLNCAVPIFLAISGYFIGKKTFTSCKDYFHFLRKQITRVYIPMLIWSLPWCILSIHYGISPLSSILMTFVGGMSIFYFIILIMQLYILTPLIQYVNKKTILGGKIAFCITTFGIIVFTYCKYIKCMNISLVASAGPFPVWIVFYVMGVAKAQERLKSIIGFKTIVWAALASIMLCMIEIKWLHQFGHIVHGIKLSAHIYSFFIIYIMFSREAQLLYQIIEKTKLVKTINSIGNYSFLIYLTHCLILWLFQKLHIPNIWLYSWTLCLILSYTGAILMNKTIPARYKRYVGL